MSKKRFEYQKFYGLYKIYDSGVSFATAYTLGGAEAICKKLNGLAEDNKRIILKNNKLLQENIALSDKKNHLQKKMGKKDNEAYIKENDKITLSLMNHIGEFPYVEAMRVDWEGYTANVELILSKPAINERIKEILEELNDTYNVKKQIKLAEELQMLYNTLDNMR